MTPLNMLWFNITQAIEISPVKDQIVCWHSSSDFYLPFYKYDKYNHFK